VNKKQVNDWILPAQNAITECGIAENGKVIEITKKSISCENTVPSGAVLVDGSGGGTVGSVVMRDRHRLAEDGMVVIVIPFLIRMVLELFGIVKK
jgi:mRNA degradation ribonuclease J1/J2